jgi:hypothetical protein
MGQTGPIPRMLFKVGRFVLPEGAPLWPGTEEERDFIPFHSYAHKIAKAVS